MFLKLLSVLLFALQLQPSLSQSPSPPSKLQWKISNLQFRRFVNKEPHLTGFFSIDRIYYEPCLSDPDAACGIVATNKSDRAVLCHSEGYLGAPFAVSDTNQYYSCLGYGMSGGGREVPLPEEWSRWMKWRYYDLNETVKSGEQPAFQSFQSIKAQLLNAVPIVKPAPGRKPGEPVATTDMLKVFTTSFTLLNSHDFCVGASQAQIAKWKPGSEEAKIYNYACDIKELVEAKGAVQTAKCGNVHSDYDYECSWLVDIEEKELSRSQFASLFKE